MENTSTQFDTADLHTRASSPKQKQNPKLLALLLALIALPLMLAVAWGGTPPWFSKAALGTTTLTLKSSSSTLNPNSTITLGATSQSAISYLLADIVFDRSKIQLAGEVTNGTALKTVHGITSMSEANSTGMIRVNVGLSTTDRANPASIGTFTVASLPFKAVPGATGSTTVSITLGTSQVVDSQLDVQQLQFSPLVVTVNSAGTPLPTTTPRPTATPAPTTVPTSTPIGTATPKPTVVPTNTPRPTPTVAPTSTPSTGASQITIYAAGSVTDGGYPTMDLLINDARVKSWTNVNGDYRARQFKTYTYTSQTRVSPGQVKIAFTNDATNSGAGEDRNLYVDKIIIDGATYETENSSTYSTGTWSNSNGCGPGYKQAEVLHCPGYFHYQTQVSPTGNPNPTKPPATPPSGGGSSKTVTFDDRYGSGNNLNGQYPANVIDWGTDAWYLSGPWEKFTTNSISFIDETARRQTLRFISPKVLTSVAVYNGGISSSTVTFSCNGNPTKTVSVASQALITVVTGWSNPCSAVDVGSSTGWRVNFDNLLYK